MANCCAGLGVLFGRGQPTSPVVSKEELSELVAEAIQAEVKHLREHVVQDLRKIEVAISSKLNDSKRKQPLREVEVLQERLHKTEQLRRRRSLEAGALRKVIEKVRTTFLPENQQEMIEQSSTPGCSMTSSPRSEKEVPSEILAEVKAERTSWAAERTLLEEQISEMENAFETGPIVPVYDPEKEYLKRSLKQLQMSIESRDRYGCWVCNQQGVTQADSDDDESPDESSSAAEEDEKENKVPAKLAKSNGFADEVDDEEASMRKDIADMIKELKMLQGGNVNFAEEDSTSAELCEVNGPMRSIRGRIATPFIQPYPMDASQQDAGVTFHDASVDVEEVSPKYPGTGMRSVRDRIATPFVGQGMQFENTTEDTAAAPAEAAAVQFSEAVSTEAYNTESDQPMRRSRGRRSTPFISPDTAQQMGEPISASASDESSRAGVQFSEVVSTETQEVDVDQPLRRVRGRISTPFSCDAVLREHGADAASPSAASPSESRGIQFAADVSTEVVEAGGEADQPMRRVRDRIATPFTMDSALAVHGAEVSTPGPAPADEQNVHFAEEASEDEKVEVDQPMRRTRGRIATPFTRDDVLQQHAVSFAAAPAAREVQFAADVSTEAVEASEEPNKPLRRVRDRIATPFTSDAALSVHVAPGPAAPASASNRAVGFSEEVDTSPVSPGEVDGPMRHTRDRIATPFTSGDVLQQHDATAASSPQSRGVQFATEVNTEVVDASEESAGPMRSLRDRIATPFTSDSALSVHAAGIGSVGTVAAPTDDKSVQFAEEHSEDVEVVVDQPMRRTRGRISTPFTSEGVLQQHDVNVTFRPNSREVQFAADVSTEVVEGDGSPDKPMRSARDRIATPFTMDSALSVHGSAGSMPVAGEDRSVHFSAEPVSEALQVEVEADQPMRRARDRIATPFTSGDALEPREVQFAEAMSTEVAPGPLRAVRDARSVGFSESVSEDVQVVDEAVPMRASRDRIATPFVSGDCLSPELGRRDLQENDAPPRVQFSSVVDTQNQELDADAPPMTRSRGRISTPHVGANELAEIQGLAARSTTVRVAEQEPEVLDAASAATGGGDGSMRRKVRERVSTGFVHGAPLTGTEGAGVRFVPDDCSERTSGENASHVRVRTRQATGFVRDSPNDAGHQIDAATGGVRFAEEVVDAASEANDSEHVAQSKRRVRQATGFVRNTDHHADSGTGGVRFADNSEADATSEASHRGHAANSKIRARQATGFVKDVAQHADPGTGGVRFAEDTEEAEAASWASRRLHAAQSKVRARQATGFVRDTDTHANSSSSSVRFAEDSEEEDASGEASHRGHAAKLRARQATGFVHDTAHHVDAGTSGVRFAEDSEVADAATETSHRGHATQSKIRARQATGFVHGPDDHADAGTSGVRFAEGSGSGDGSSEASHRGHAANSKLRARQATGFVHDTDHHVDAGTGGVRFADNSEADATSEASHRGNAAQSKLRARQATGFVKDVTHHADSGTGGVRFAEDTEEVEAASETGHRGQAAQSKLRARQATGFVHNTDHHANSSSSGVRFAEDSEEEEDAASEAKHRGHAAQSKLRARQATGFVRDTDHHTSSGTGGVRFAEESEVADAASETSHRGHAAQSKIRARQATGFVHNTDHHADSGSGGVRFAEDSEVVDIASEAGHREQAAQSKVRARQATGFVHDTDHHTNASSSSVRFAEDSEEEEAAIEASHRGQAAQSKIRARQATGFVHDTDHHADAGTSGVRFAEDSEVADAANEASHKGHAAQSKARVRQATGFVRETDHHTVATSGVRFAEDGEVPDTSSDRGHAAQSKVRARQATGFVHSASNGSSSSVHFAEDEDAGDDAREVSHRGNTSQTKLRNRQATGFVHDSGNDSPNSVRFTEVNEADSGANHSVRFAADDEMLDAASQATQAGTADGHRLRARQATGYVHSQADDGNNVRFAENRQDGDAGSATNQIRHRQATGFVHLPQADGAGGVRFADNDQVVEAASEGSQKSHAQHVRSRQATGFVHKAASAGNVRFAEEDQVMEVSEAMPTEPCSTRCTSGSERSLRFDESAQASDDDEPDMELRDSRGRYHTPHVSAQRLGVEFEDVDEDERHARQAARSMSSILSPRSGSARPSFRSSLSSPSASEDRQMIKQASLEIHAERQLSNRVRRTFSKYRAHEAGKSSPTADSDAHIHQSSGNPEHDLDRHLVSDAVKDRNLLMRTLHEIDFFEDLDDKSLEALIDAMHVYEFADQEELLRQGDADGTHFFVVAQGQFVVEQDGRFKVELNVGMSFGESVLLLYGQRSATVRARGVARCYAMEGATVRNALCDHFKAMHEGAVVTAAEDVICSGQSLVFASLDGYQLQRLYEAAKILNVQDGEDIFTQGQPPTSENMAHVVLSGSVAVKRDGVQVGLREPYSWIGAGSVECADNFLLTATAVGPTRTLVLHEKLLEDMFGDQLSSMLLKNRVRTALTLDEQMGKLDTEQLDSLASTCQVQQLRPGEELDGKNLRYVVVVSGELHSRSSDDLPSPEISTHKPWDSTCGFGEEHLLNASVPWSIRARATDSEPAQVAVWHSQDLERVMKFDNLSMEVEDKAKYLAQVFLFRTLPQEQLRRVASAIDIMYFEAGQRIMSKGDVAAEFYIIRHGSVKVEIEGRFIRNQGIKDYFGERALQSGDVRSADISAVEDCELWKMGKEAFLEIMKGKILEYLSDRIKLQDTKITFEDLLFMRVIGRGGFGVVKMVCGRRTRTRYALKCVQKKGIISQNSQKAIVTERNIMAEVDHPFIIKYVRSFASATQLYFLMELVSGGELLDALDHLGVLNRKQATFYTGCLLLALEYLHARKIAYLDLKAENCLIDHQGYVKMIDFGIAQRMTHTTCHVQVGTPIFMAPEMIRNRGYTTSADLWSLGICLYEFMTGKLPFGNQCENNRDILTAVLKAPLVFPDHLREDARSIMRGLLTRNPSMRLGSGFEGYLTLKEHAFFRDFSWDALLGRQLDPPFIPTKEVYAEGGNKVKSESDDLMSLVEQEALENVGGQDWVDPNPGWDADFN